MKTKVCAKCGETGELNAFAKDARAKSGLRSRCKTCDKKYKKRYRAKNESKLAAKDRIYYEKHREKKVAYLKVYYVEHKKKLVTQQERYAAGHKREKSTYGKIYNAEHKEERSTYGKIYKAKHRAAINAYGAKRRAAKLKATPVWADAVKIKEFYKEAHRLTRETGVSHLVDHYYPLQGKMCCGLHVETNLQVITESENCSKGNKMPEEFYTEEN